MTLFEFSNCHTEERSEAEFFVQFENERASYHALLVNCCKQQVVALE